MLVVEVLVATGVRVQLGAVDRKDADLLSPRLRAQRQNLAEQAGDRLLVALDEPRDRRVIQPLLSGARVVAASAASMSTDRPISRDRILLTSLGAAFVRARRPPLAGTGITLRTPPDRSKP